MLTRPFARAGGDKRNPLEVHDKPWLRVRNPYETERGRGYPYGGKWLVFSAPSLAPEAWAQIRDATERGDLGTGAKVATAAQAMPRGVVTCVYTYDCRDLADVTRVLTALRSLGFSGRLNYKEDLATHAGLYEGRQRGPASLYTSLDGSAVKALRPVVSPAGPA